MNRNIQWNSVILKIEELRKDLEYILNQKQSLPLIEVDIVLNKLSLIYDTLMSIKLQAAANEESGFFSKNSSLINKIIKESVFNNDEYTEDVEQKLKTEINQEHLKDDEKSLGFTFENKQTENKTNATKTTISTNEQKNNDTDTRVLKTLADSIAKPKKTLAEIMEEIYKKRDVASSQQFKSIKDLKHAISINDKIMFIRELFNNNVDNYNYVIDQVNSCSNLDEALAIIDKNVKIDSSNQALNTLLELVYRRFLN